MTKQNSPQRASYVVPPLARKVEYKLWVEHLGTHVTITKSALEDLRGRGYKVEVQDQIFGRPSPSLHFVNVERGDA